MGKSRWRMNGNIPNAGERVRLFLRQRLAELEMTGRHFGRQFSANDGQGHGDQWVSNLLAGKFALSLDELDEAARAVKSTAADMVRHPDDQAAYLRPTEQRLIADLRKLPPPIRDHIVILAEYLAGVAPPEIALLQEFRLLKDDDEREKVKHWVHALRLAQEPVPGPKPQPDPVETNEPPPQTAPHIRGLQKPLKPPRRSK